MGPPLASSSRAAHAPSSPCPTPACGLLKPLPRGGLWGPTCAQHSLRAPGSMSAAGADVVRWGWECPLFYIYFIKVSQGSTSAVGPGLPAREWPGRVRGRASSVEPGPVASQAPQAALHVWSFLYSPNTLGPAEPRQTEQPLPGSAQASGHVSGKANERSLGPPSLATTHGEVLL